MQGFLQLQVPTRTRTAILMRGEVRRIVDGVLDHETLNVI